jgi:CzcA family heavy metal efflux pump
MLSAIVRFSIRFRGIVLALACALLIYGWLSLSRMPYSVFPDFAAPQVEIQTEAPGLSPQQVEMLVTRRIENAINGALGIDILRSRSIQGLSVITVIFRDGTNIYLDRQAIAERLASVAGELPAGVQTPLMTPLTTSTNWTMIVGLTSRQASLMSVRTVADWTVKPALLAVRGVAGVEVIGGDVRQLQVQFEPQQLLQHGVSVQNVIAAAQKATGVRGAGFADTANQRIVLRTEGQSLTPAELANTVVVHSNGANVLLGDVAQVKDAPAPAIGAATVRGKPAVVLIVDTAYGANVVDVTRGLDTALSNLRPALEKQGIDLHTNIFRAVDFIDIALHNIRDSLLIGGVLVVAVLFLFLFNFRIAAISCAAIPLSLLAAVIMLANTGLTLNTMTLGGLSIAIGVVVDDAVIDVENIYRRLRENRASSNPRSVFRVVLDASIEVRSAVVYASFAVMLVFLPVLGMSGVAGKLFGPLAMAYIWAILMSLIVALTVTPALCVLMLGRGELPPEEPPAVHWLKHWYGAALKRTERLHGKFLWLVAGMVAVGIIALFFVNESFLPELREGDITVHMTELPGTSLQESLRLGNRISEALLKIPSVTMVSQRAGRAELGTDTMGTHQSEIDVNLQARSGKQVAAAQADIRKVLSEFPGPTLSFNGFLIERINETLSGYVTPVVVNIFGNNLNQLDQDGAQIAALLNEIPGAANVQLQSPPGMPQMVVRLRKEDLARWGFDPVDVLDVVRTAYSGDIVGQIYAGDRVFDVSVILARDSQPRVSALGSLLLESPGRNYVPLHQLADIYEAPARYVILHEGARRVQTVTCNVRGRSVDAFVNEAKKRISNLSLPTGTYVEFTGTAEAQARSRRDLFINSTLAMLGIILLLSIVMRNYRNLLLVLLNLPFALVGGVLAGWITGGNLSLGSLVGFVTLFGITVRNSIMLISHYEHLVQVEGEPWRWETALRGASERLSPILMTALVTGLGLLPLAVGSGDPGREIEGPMAIIILGGLITSTVLNLLVLPTLALRYGRFESTPVNGQIELPS